MAGPGGGLATGTRPRLESATGWLLPPARRVVSPNCDDRPDGDGVEVVIIHAISLPPACYDVEAVSALFTNCLDPSAHPYFAEVAPMRVSSHFLVDRAGRIVQFVPVGMRAWHAGVSSCLGRERVNDFSVGIELAGCDDESFTLAQYQATAALVDALREFWPALRPDRLFGHNDIAPGRKTDPGPCFDFARLRAGL